MLGWQEAVNSCVYDCIHVVRVYLPIFCLLLERPYVGMSGKIVELGDFCLCDKLSPLTSWKNVHASLGCEGKSGKRQACFCERAWNSTRLCDFTASWKVVLPP